LLLLKKEGKEETVVDENWAEVKQKYCVSIE
jgi:hypothetical protein